MGNKTDLREEYAMYKKDPKEAPIMRETARKIIEEEFQCKYMECSALTQDGLKNIFDEAMRIVIQKKMKPIVKKKQESSFCSLIWFRCGLLQANSVFPDQYVFFWQQIDV